MMQDDVRAQLAMLYLRHNRVQDARMLVNDVRLDRRPDAKSKALYAAITAEAFARSGAPEEARKLLETYDAADPAYDDVRVMLLRAQVYACIALKKRGLAKKALDELAAIEPNLLGGFLVKGGGSADLNKLVKQTLAESGVGKPKFKWQA